LQRSTTQRQNPASIGTGQREQTQLHVGEGTRAAEQVHWRQRAECARAVQQGENP